MDLLPETEEYIRETIESSLGLQISAKNMQLRLITSEDERHHLQDQVFYLEDRLRNATQKIDLYKSEASMNAKALKKCMEEKMALSDNFDELSAHCGKLEKECSLFERDLERLMDSLDESARENDELRARLTDQSQVVELTAQVETLQKDKDNLLLNLSRAEEEVSVLFEENKMLEDSNKKLLALLEREKEWRQRSEKKNSTSGSATGKRKAGLTGESPPGKTIDFNVGTDPTRPPLSPLRQNSPESRMHKK